MGKEKGIPRDIDLVTKHVKDKHKWNWVIRVDKLRYHYQDSTPVIDSWTVLPEFIKLTTSGKEQEFELIDALTTDRGNFGAPSETKLYKLLQHQPDQLYRMVVFKQSVSSKIFGWEGFAFWGWNLISKKLDKIFFETRYFQHGKLHGWNLETRDPQRDSKVGHVSETPSGGIDYKW